MSTVTEGTAIGYAKRGLFRRKRELFAGPLVGDPKGYAFPGFEAPGEDNIHSAAEKLSLGQAPAVLIYGENQRLYLRAVDTFVDGKKAPYQVGMSGEKEHVFLTHAMKTIIDDVELSYSYKSK